jgi:hypothetical protein
MVARVVMNLARVVGLGRLLRPGPPSCPRARQKGAKLSPLGDSPTSPCDSQSYNASKARFTATVGKET